MHETRFFLLHLSLLRNYLELEFSPVRSKINFEFNIESIIDDWILMGFLVGNDFIPHLPNIHIASGALPMLYKVYMEVLPKLDGKLPFMPLKRMKTKNIIYKFTGYINDKGILKLER